MYKNFCLVLILAGCVAGCSEEAATPAASAMGAEAAYKSALDAANQAREKATQSGNEWTGAQILMDDAAVLAGEGKFAEAAALLDEASLQIELAVAQARLEARAWSNRVIR